jgi:hypothetical protein
MELFDVGEYMRAGPSSRVVWGVGLDRMVAVIVDSNPS